MILESFDISQVKDFYTLIAFVVVAIMTYAGDATNRKKIKKTDKRIEELSRDDKQDAAISELGIQIEQINEKIDVISDFITKDRRISNFNFKLLTFYNDFLNRNVLDEDFKVIYQYAITQAGELYKQLISGDLEHLSNEIFYLMLKSKIISIYDKFKSVKNIKSTDENLEKVKQLIYSEMDILSQSFKIIQAQKSDGVLMDELSKYLENFTKRIFYKSYKILS